ncbi:ABC transporter substrate-binding protein [Pseudomonas sp. UL073]|uniref:ABC transporter substrate-binding protein n=1 Tax=Zestomonas insulae TaxID=2809017 RepID=A0ABS2IG24_9GAMM|nr:ABC transporter substrate-binding protein [Pseudomonas insulae]MBM7062019.1 ABC transporter substrate-binding protein [Pseudomonas insulae]
MSWAIDVKRVLRIGAFLWCLFGVATVHAASVAFLNPGRADEPFWRDYSRFMQAAANNLGMQLDIYYSERDRHRMVDQARQLLSGAQRPDYLLFVNEEYAAPEILRLSKSSGVKLFLLHNSLTADQQQLLGQPREKYANWIGSMVANDEEAGFLMADQLIREYQARHGKGAVDLLAFAGMRLTPVSQAREQGMRRALAAYPEVKLRQMVLGDWSRQRAYEQAQQLLPRYPQTRLIWSANDEMAFGAMRAVQERGGVPGSDVLFSALNSSAEVLQARMDGRVSALVAGHFTLGGWAMVLLHDYDAGVDFAAHGGIDRREPLFRLFDKAQAQRLLQHVQKRGYDLDFRRFSLVGRKGATDYQFSLQPLLD